MGLQSLPDSTATSCVAPACSAVVEEDASRGSNGSMLEQLSSWALRPLCSCPSLHFQITYYQCMDDVLAQQPCSLASPNGWVKPYPAP